MNYSLLLFEFCFKENGIFMFILVRCFTSESLTRACSDRYGNFGCCNEDNTLLLKTLYCESQIKI